MEGSTIVTVARPDLQVFVAHPWLSPERWKPTSAACVAAADLVVVNRPAADRASAVAGGAGRAARRRSKGEAIVADVTRPPSEWAPRLMRDLAARPCPAAMAGGAPREDVPRPQPGQRRRVHVLRPRLRPRAHRRPRDHARPQGHPDPERGGAGRPCTRSPRSPSTPSPTSPTTTPSCRAAAASATATARCSWRASRIAPSDVARRTVAVPGMLTTAYLALRLFAPEAETRVVPFDQILDEVQRGPRRRRADHPRGPAHVRRPRPAQGRGPRRLVEGRDRPSPSPRRQRRAPRPGRGPDAAAHPHRARDRALLARRTARRPSPTP